MMRPWQAAATLGIGLTAFSGATAFQSPTVTAPTAAGWLPSFEAAQAAARQAGKPIFLVFR